jgi:methylmalonyl-CoA/ethylmalonyl-CoA epimerase
MMKLNYIEHIGIAVNDLGEGIKLFQDQLGLKCYKTETIEDQKVKTAFFILGRTKIELLQPIAGDSPVARHIEKRGEGLHHLAFHVDDTDAALGELAEKGTRLVDQKSRKGAEGMDIGFLHPKSTLGALIELCSPGSKKEG